MTVLAEGSLAKLPFPPSSESTSASVSGEKLTP